MYEIIKGFVCYILARLFFRSKRNLWHLEKEFSVQSSFGSRGNQGLKFQILKFHDVIKCLA